MRNPIFLFVGILLLLCAPSCTSNPATGEKEVNWPVVEVVLRGSAVELRALPSPSEDQLALADAADHAAGTIAALEASGGTYEDVETAAFAFLSAAEKFVVETGDPTVSRVASVLRLYLLVLTVE